MKRSIFSQIGQCCLTLAIGVLIVAQMRTHNRARAVTFNADDRAVLLCELVNANQNLRGEVESLQTQLAAYEEKKRGTVLEELVEEMNRVKIVNGEIEVSGPGIELVIDGPASVLDLQDLINELRNAGAEAIALNEQRLVAQSVLTLNDDQLILDGYPIRQPFRFQAIGDPSTLETAILRPGGVVDLLRHASPNLVLQSEQKKRLVLPVCRSQTGFEYAEPIN